MGSRDCTRSSASMADADKGSATNARILQCRAFIRIHATRHDGVISHLRQAQGRYPRVRDMI